MEWRKIIMGGYTTIYSVSSTGEVRNDNTGYILKKQMQDGYMKVGLTINGNMKRCSIHRLVATAFIPNPDNLPIVNHLDGIKNNNNVENLEWTTVSGNALHAHQAGLIGYQKRRPVRQFSANGDWLMDFESATEAARQCELLPEKIIDVCRGNRKTHGKYQWRYQDSGIEKLPPATTFINTGRKVAQYTKEGEFIATYESYREAARAVNGTPASISRVCSDPEHHHTHKGFVWKIVDEIVQDD